MGGEGESNKEGDKRSGLMMFPFFFKGKKEIIITGIGGGEGPLTKMVIL